jgi:hypothetical protein
MPIREIPKAKRQRDAAIIAAVAAVPISAFVVVGWHWGAAGFAVLAALAIVLTLRVATETIPDAPNEAELAAQRVQEARQRLRQDADDAQFGRWMFGIVWVLTFAGCWIYCIATYGFLIGVGIGWLPSGIVATIAAFLWPLVLLGVLALAVFVGFNL